MNKGPSLTSPPHNKNIRHERITPCGQLITSVFAGWGYQANVLLGEGGGGHEGYSAGGAEAEYLFTTERDLAAKSYLLPKSKIGF